MPHDPTYIFPFSFIQDVALIYPMTILEKNLSNNNDKKNKKQLAPTIPTKQHDVVKEFNILSL